MTAPRRIELLAPAKTADIGREAIVHGADAVYIGGPAFGARAAAGNSIADIARLADFAHTYHARVYAAVNTILYDNELRQVERLITDLCRAGVDALIVQDMGILRLDIPPVALHASTQCDNRTVEKVRFLHEAGFSRVVLARELSASEIREIAAAVPIDLEVFVHGALCVSYSGQCYLSRCLSGRSANRGECAQYCRLPYTLLDADGTPLLREKHLLSLKDMNRSDRLETLLDAGVTSLKIEGRLKERSYVKNITAWYRRRLDEIFARRPEYCAASSGRVEYTFEPDPFKSFNRGFTHYFLDGVDAEPIGSPHTPKSLGEPVAHALRRQGAAWIIDRAGAVGNGDGLCFFDGDRRFEGFRVNRAEGCRIYPAEMPHIPAGALLYRNSDCRFEQLLQHRSAQRRIPLDLTLYETPQGYALKLLDADGCMAIAALAADKMPARTPQSDGQRAMLSRLGDTCFAARTVTIALAGERFIPVSQLAALRRDAVAALDRSRRLACRPPRRREEQPTPFPAAELAYTGNVANEAARRFYREHGVSVVAPAYECAPPADVPLMYTRFCLRRQWGCCLKEKSAARKWKAPLYLQYRDARLRLEFDCARCEMHIYADSRPATSDAAYSRCGSSVSDKSFNIE